MKKVPITDVINSWLKADARLAEQCKEDICEYHSDSAYRGFMLGFDEGVNSQIISEDEAKKMLLITKREIVNGFKNVDVFFLNNNSIVAVGPLRCFPIINSLILLLSSVLY